MRKQFGHVFVLSLALSAVNAYAVPTLEIGSPSASGTDVQGPTHGPLTYTYRFDANNPLSGSHSDSYFPKITVSYKVENIQYSTGSAINQSSLVMGGTSVASGSTIGAASTFRVLNAVGSATWSDFSSNVQDIGVGIDITNYGTAFFINARALENKIYVQRTSSSLGYYMGDIVMTFSRPVKNPILSLSGMGSALSGSRVDPSVGFTANFELSNPPAGVSVERLSGRNFTVDGNKIYNSYNGQYNETTGSGGASGSVRIKTENAITELRIKVYVASNKSTGNYPASAVSGDGFAFSMSSIDSMVGDLLIEKTNNIKEVVKGANTTYTVRVTNKGPDTFTGTFLNDYLAQGLELVKVECSTVANNKCTDSSKPDPNKLFVSDAELTSATNTGQDTGPLAKDTFYEVLVTAKVTGAVAATTINKASVKLPTMGASTGVSCTNSSSLGGTDTGLTRAFNSTLGICSVTDTDKIIKPAVDLAVSKVTNKANYNIGENVTYTIKAWNIGTHTMPDAVLTDTIPSSLAALGVSCKAVGKDSAGLDLVCPTADKITLVNNQLSVKDMVLPKTTDTGTNPVAYLEFTVVALAKTAGTSIVNTANIAVPKVGADSTATETNIANNTATATISIKAPYIFSGRVFNDNSGSTKVVANAYNGIVDTGELGISGSTVTLKNCIGTPEYASAQTNGNGDFEINTFLDVFGAGSQVCLVQKNLEGYESVSSAKATAVTAVVDTGHDLFTVTKNTSSNIYEGFLFGDAQLQLILTQNGQKNIAAGDVVDYPHEIISKSVHKLGNVSPSNTQQPTTGQAWSSLVYYDANCNGVVDVGEQQYDVALKSTALSTSILPDQKICLVQRVVSPSSAKSGDSLSAQFAVKHTPTVSGSSEKLSNKVQDMTTVGSAGLDLVKSVREVKSCPSTEADTTIFVKTNTLTKVQNQTSYLEYKINYTNNSTKNLINVTLKDAVPLGTSLKSMCTENNCNGVSSNTTPLNWNIAGVLAPRATGTVRFCVEVQ